MNEIRCEYCGRLLHEENEPYLMNDQGKTRAFCGKTHSWRYCTEKYSMALPLDYGDAAPFFGYETDNSPLSKRGVTRARRRHASKTRGGDGHA